MRQKLCVFLTMVATSCIAQLSGTVTINSGAPATITNFQSFTAFAAILNTAGVSGPLTVNVVAGSGPYNEQPSFNVIPGGSSINAITINGNNNVLSFNASGAQPWTLSLDGSDFMYFNNLIINGLGATYAWPCILSGGADHNFFSSCTFSCPSNCSSLYQVPVVFRGSKTQLTGGPSASYNTFVNCSLLNGFYCLEAFGPDYEPYSSNNSFINCYFGDWYGNGLYVTGQQSLTVSKCTFERPTRTIIPQSGSIYGIWFEPPGGPQPQYKNLYGTRCIDNCFQNFFGGINYPASAAYGIYFSSYTPHGNFPANTFSGNVISNLGANASIIGMSIRNSNGICNSNTIILNNTAANPLSGSSTGILYLDSGSDSAHIFNNCISINQGGAIDKCCMNIPSGNANMLINYNRYFMATGSGTNILGYDPGAAPTFTDWQGLGNDLQGLSYSVNPNFGVASSCGVITAPVPASSFSFPQENICPGEAVIFSDVSTNNPVSWSWAVTPSVAVTINSPSSQNPQITFGYNGIFTVCLIASNAAGSGTPNYQLVNVLGCIGIENNGTSEGMDIVIFPNPVGDNLRIELRWDQPVNLVVTNGLGEIMKLRKNSTLPQTLDVSDLAKGIYFLRIESRYWQKSFKMAKN